jgi:gluconate/galactonate dehydratase
LAAVKIAAVHTAVVEGNYDWTFVRVDADVEGLRGLGECFGAPGLTAIVRDLAPLLIGEDPRDVDRLWGKLRWGASGAGSPAGIVYNAISGLEAALWDLVGRAYGVPVYRLLGGKFRDSVRMYADCHAGEALESMDATMVPRPARWAQDPPEALAAGAVRAPAHGRAYAAAPPDELYTPEMYARRAREVVDEHGFSALKFDLDVPTAFQQDTASGTLTRAEVRMMVELAAAVIDAVGDEVDVAFDCHWRYQVADACRLAHELEPLGLMWLEDPVPPENVAALRRVTRSTATPIATGENGYLRHGFREAFETGALDIAAPDLQKTGGLLEGRRIADYADTHYIALAPHCIASPIGTVASVHVAAAVPNFLALEWHGMSVPYWSDLALGWDGPVISGGRIRVPEGPGLGVELNLDVAREYARPGEPFFDEDGS